METYIKNVKVYEFEPDRVFNYQVCFTHERQTYWEPEHLTVNWVEDEDGNPIDESHAHYAEATEDLSFNGDYSYA